MNGPSEPRLFLCCPVRIWEHMPAELKALAMRDDAPYERLDCPRCRQPMLLSKHGRAMLDAGTAESAVCTDCLLAIARADGKL